MKHVMPRRRAVLLTVLLTVLALTCAPHAPRAAADVIFYNIPRTNMVVVLQGKTTVNPGRTLTYRHPKFGNLVFALEDARVEKAPTVESQFARRLAKATSDGDANGSMEAARWALKHGMVDACYKAAAQALKFDPQHVAAGHVRDLYRQIHTPLPTSPDDEQRLRTMIPKSDMKVTRSAHFILLHDTPDRPERNQRLTRAEERLALLEQVYESFLLQLYSHGVELQIPQERLQVVLFNNHNEYLLYAKSLSPQLASASGFWNSQKYVSVFFDHASTDRFKVVKALSDQLQQLKADAIRNVTASSRDTVRLADTLSLLMDREHSNIDFIVGNQIFSLAATHGAKLHGYGQAWALTHFMVERHFDKYMTFCRRLGEMPPDVPLSAELLTAVFDEAFGTDRQRLDTEWRLYMRSLKTDLQMILDDASGF